MKIRKSLFMMLVLVIGVVKFSAAQEIPGCMDEGACNYNVEANVSDNSCQYAQQYFYDNDGDGYGVSNITAIECQTPPGFADNYYDCDDNNGSVALPEGNPSEWGVGEWNAYVYEGPNFNTYKGYYVRQGLSYNSEVDFNAWGTPMSAPGYMGCPVSEDYHSVRYKRQGFPSNEFPYAITIPSWDDDVYVYVDGNMVWSTGCCASGLNDNIVWSGVLNESSMVEIAFGEYGGASYVSFVVEPQYPLNISGSTYINHNACFNFNYSTQVIQGFGELPNTMQYSISSANGLVDTENYDISFDGSQVLFGLHPLQVLGEDVLTIVVTDNMGFSDTLLTNVNLMECPPPLDIWGSTESYNDACTSFDFYIGVSSPYGYSTDELTFVTTFDNESFVQSTSPTYFDNWFDGGYIGFDAAGVLGSTMATTVVTDPLGNSDTLITQLFFGDCYPIIRNDYNWMMSCGDSVGTFSISYAFNNPNIEQSISYIESSNGSAAPIENLSLVSTHDTVLVENGIEYYGTTYNYQFEFDYLGEWTEFYGALNDDQNANYNFSVFFSSILDNTAPNVYASQSEVEIVLPVGACDTLITWDVILNPVNAFGSGSTYLTNQHEGTFYAAINGGNGLNFLGVDGNSGADCSGEVIDGSFEIATPSGTSFNVFYSIMNDTGDPLTHQLWFVPSTEMEATTSIDYEICDHRFVIEGLSGTPQPYFFYLFSSLEYGTPYDLEIVQQVAQNVANGFDPFLNETFDLSGLSANMGSVIGNVNATILNDGNYFPIQIEGDFVTDDNNSPVGINDGGGDIYDGANYIITNFNDYYYYEGFGIPYTNGEVTPGGPTADASTFSLFIQEGCSYELVSSIDNGSLLPVGMTEIEFIVTDNSGNQTTQVVAVNILPSGSEICNDLDDNCDGEVDEFVLGTFYADMDGDGFGNADETAFACSAPEGFTDNFEDCDDALLTYLDVDGDGSGSSTIDACGASSNDDCDDSNGQVNPSASEVCGNDIDDNCDGTDAICILNGCTDASACNYDVLANTDNGTCIYPSAPYLNCSGNCINDTDADGVCDELEVVGCTDVTACNYDLAATDNGECTYPTESYLNCSGNCINDTDTDGVCDELEVVGCTDVTACNYDPAATDNGECTYPTESYLNCSGNCINDTDTDGVCDELEVVGCTDVTACNYDMNATDDDGSCILPAEEVCNEADDDCDGEIDEFVTNTYFMDADGDGFGSTQEVVFACSMPLGYVSNSDDCDDALLTYEDNDNDGYGSTVSVSCGIEDNTDCNDNDAQINSGIAELCNGIDDNCNGSADDGLVFVDYYTDADVDGYGFGTAVSFCTNPGAGFSTTSDDCDDMNAQINPGATEVEGNQVDENCDGEVLSVNTTEVVIEMYPNPTRNQFSVVNTSAQRSELIICNALGELVFKTTMTEDKLMINCSSWSAGMYLVQMKNAETIQSATLIVQ